MLKLRMETSKFVLLGALVLSLGLGACSKKKDLKAEGDNFSQQSAASTDDINGGTASSDSNNAMGLQTIHFPFDSFEIVGENKELLRTNVKILKDNPALKVQVEGHCDERGGIQYNLALGEKRAAIIKRQLLSSGIEKNRITTISMGKEKPAVSGTGEEVWAKNRRGNFVITEK